MSKVKNDPYKKTVSVFSKYKKPMTTADISAGTGCALHDITAILPAICDEFGARLQVTESGELLYSFPKGMKSRYTGFFPTLRRFASAALRFLKKTGILLFKIWIAATLIVYVATFILLIVAAIVLAIAGTMAGNKDNSSRRRNSDGSGILIIRVLELANRILFYNSVMAMSNNANHYGYNYHAQNTEQKEKRPLHVSVFSFVFGEPDSQIDLDDRIRKAVIAYIRKNKGCITLPEFIIVTEFPPLKAEQELLRFLKDFHGEPTVSQNGSILYTFPEITATVEDPRFSSGERTGVVRNLNRFSSNTKKSNVTYCLLNAFNLLMGLYFFINTAFMAKPVTSYLFAVTTVLIEHFLPTLNAPLITGLGLGLIPIAFSILFFLIPLIRNISNNRKNEKLKKDNLRSVVYNQIWETPRLFNPASIIPKGALISPKQDNAVAQLAQEAASYFGADIPAEAPNRYDYGEIEQTKKDVTLLREKAKNTSATGDVVFDSDR